MPHERNTRHIKTSFVLMTILFVLTLAAFSWLLIDVRSLSHKTAHISKTTAHLSVENAKRINEIQNSRVYSCKKNYRAIPEVFRPFFPKKQTNEQKKGLAKLHRVVKRLVRGCSKQTRPIG